jgi:hypothetical protein
VVRCGGARRWNFHARGAADGRITAYNEVDCKVMMEILALLREQH